MAYTGKQWQCGDVINAADLNRIERGIEAVGIETNIQNPTDGQTLKYDAASGKWVNGEGGSGSSTLVVNGTYDQSTDTVTLDKTWQEIYDACPNVVLIVPTGNGNMKEALINASERGYTLSFANTISTFKIDTYQAASATEYPTSSSPS